MKLRKRRTKKNETKKILKWKNNDIKFKFQRQEIMNSSERRCLWVALNTANIIFTNYLVTLAMCCLRRNGLTSVTHALSIGPILTKWIVHSFTGNRSNFAPPIRQFFGINQDRIEELSPLQSAIMDIPLICVDGSLSNTSNQRSSIILASVYFVVAAIFPIRN